MVSPLMKILVVDDHALVREALRGVLRELKDDAAVIEAPDSGVAVKRIDENPDLDLIVLDLYLPDRDGFEFLVELRECHPAISVVVLSASNESEDITRALELGTLGFIPKSTQREVMLNAFKLIFSGGIYVPPEIFDRPQPAPAMQAQARRVPSAAALGLTQRQMDVLALMMQGKSNKAICRVLDISEPTVKNHVTAILKALRVTNRTEAVIAAGAWDWSREKKRDRSD